MEDTRCLACLNSSEPRRLDERRRARRPLPLLVTLQVQASGNGTSSGVDAMNRAIGSKIKAAAESYAADRVCNFRSLR